MNWLKLWQFNWWFYHENQRQSVNALKLYYHLLIWRWTCLIHILRKIFPFSVSIKNTIIRKTEVYAQKAVKFNCQSEQYPITFSNFLVSNEIPEGVRTRESSIQFFPRYEPTSQRDENLQKKLGNMCSLFFFFFIGSPSVQK